MKVVFMQNNAEQIFDDFIMGKLENVAPDMALLDSSFNAFLLERKAKKKKWRWFFWLFLLLPVFVIPFSYYIITHKGNLTISKQSSNKASVSIGSKKDNNSLNSLLNESVKLPVSVFVNQAEVSNSMMNVSSKANGTKNVNKPQQRNFNSHPGSIQQNKGHYKPVGADSTIFSVNSSQKIVINTIDSSLGKKNKPISKTDTLYIVW